MLEQEAALEAERLAFRELGETPCIRIGLAPKRLLVYRAETPFKSLKRHPLEALGLGSQFVAYAMHPDTGRPYEWPVDHLADVPLFDLPAVSEAQVRAFLDKAFPLVPAHRARHPVLRTQFVEDGAGPFRLLHDARLGKLQFEAARFEPAFGKRPQNGGDQIRIPELAGRKIDRHHHTASAGILPGSDLTTHRT